MIELKNISKAYDKNLVLDNINLDLQADRIYGLIGRNGVGKTTLIKILADRIIKYEGDILVDGTNIKNHPSFKEDVVIITDGFISENENPSRLTTLTSTFRLLSPSFNQKRYDELMAMFDLDKLTKYNKLSYGNQSLYRSILALSTGAKLILLDEPVNGLDEINRDKLYKKILEYQEADGSTVVVSSHILSDIEKVVTDIIFLTDKKVALNEPIDQLEEKAYRVTISEDDIKLLEGKNILSYKKIGHQLVVSIYDDFTTAELSALQQKATVSPMNLQDLFKAINKEA